MELLKKNTLIAGYWLLCAALLFFLLTCSFEMSLVLAAVIGCVLLSVLVINSGIYNLLFFFILYLPFQDLLAVLLSLTGVFPRDFLRALLGGKEILLCLLAVYLVSLKRLFKPRSFEIFLMLFLGWTILYAVLPDGILFEESNPQARLMGLRNTLVPILLYFAGRQINYDREKYVRAFKLLFIVSFVVAALGVFEMFFIDRSKIYTTCLVQLDSLKRSEENLDDHIDYLMVTDDYSMRDMMGKTVPRLVSVYFKPLQAAYSLMTVIGFATVFLVFRNYSLIGFRRKFFYLFYVLIGTAFLLTITRAAVAAALFIVILICLLSRQVKYAVIIGLFLALFCLPVMSYVIDYVQESYKFGDPSSQGHVAECTRGLKILADEFWGVGLGQGGSVGGAYGQLKASGENLYLAIGTERGVFCLVLFILFVMSLLLALYKAIQNDRIKGFEKNILVAVFALTAGFALTSLTTETWFGFKDAFVYWWLLGLCGQWMFDRDALPAVERGAV